MSNEEISKIEEHLTPDFRALKDIFNELKFPLSEVETTAIELENINTIEVVNKKKFGSPEYYVRKKRAEQKHIISNSGIINIGDKNEITQSAGSSSQVNTTQRAAAQHTTIKKMLIGILVALVSGLLLWWLTS